MHPFKDERITTLLDSIDELSLEVSDKSQQIKMLQNQIKALQSTDKSGVIIQKQNESHSTIAEQRKSTSNEKSADQPVIETETYISHKFIRGKEFDRPSPGVIIPNHLEGNEKIQWLMENDPAFKR